MLKRLPEYIDPIPMAYNGQKLVGQLDLARMERLAPALAPPHSPPHSPHSKGKVDIQLVFGIDAAGIPYIRGRLWARVGLICQRCMQPMSYILETAVNLGLVSALSEADRFPAHYEPLLVEADELALVDIIEDELLLALPIAPIHAVQECSIKIDYSSDTKVAAQEHPNPFAMLQGLKMPVIKTS